MKKNYSRYIIILSTVISVTTISSYSAYISNRNQYEKFNQAVAMSNSNLIPSKNKDDYIEHNVVKNEYIEAPYVKENLEKTDLPEEKLSSDIKSEDENKTEMDKYIYNGMYLPEDWDSIENYNYNNEQNEQSVFKVSTGQIVEKLTTSDKIKLLYISIKLGKEDYKNVEKHLNSQDAEDGVLKALKLLKENLSEKEYKKVRVIAEKFIDMDAAERLY